VITVITLLSTDTTIFIGSPHDPHRLNPNLLVFSQPLIPQFYRAFLFVLHAAKILLPFDIFLYNIFSPTELTCRQHCGAQSLSKTAELLAVR